LSRRGGAITRVCDAVDAVNDLDNVSDFQPVHHKFDPKSRNKVGVQRFGIVQLLESFMKSIPGSGSVR
jgi:hypothetical protein